MKKITSFLFAMVSTMFLFAGATRAAEKFDGLVRSEAPVITGAMAQLPAAPCAIDPDPMA
jgi:hypothetical protein